jgi:cation diffusion facilitator CzcD-associated flavoprotein CzcO
VLIVGGGNSAVDIACEAARNADKAYISMRRGYHFIPKHIFGQPADVFAHSGPKLPWRLEEIVFGLLINHVLVGNLGKYGLPKPDHPILRSHPIMNTQILRHLANGELQYRPDVKELRGSRVAFADGRDEEIDLIVWATGYRRRFPFLDEAQYGARPNLYLELCSRTDPSLFFMGVFEVDGAAFPLHGLQADIISRYLHAREHAPAVAARFENECRSAHPDLRGGKPYVASLRHEYYVRAENYERELRLALDRLG